jgi:hypothetical protein
MEIISRIPDATYDNISEILQEMTEILGEDAIYYRITDNRAANILVFELSRKTASTDKPHIEFSPNFAAILGTPLVISGDGFHTSSGYNIAALTGAMFVYSDICKASTVGDTISPLLAIIAPDISSECFIY